MKIFLVRHGQTDWNVDGRIMGNNDTPLNRIGEHEAQTVANFLKDKSINRIITSPVFRAKQTANIISKHIDAPVFTDERFTEMDFGKWTGEIYQEIKREKGFKSYYEYPDDPVIPRGETFNQASKRVVGAFKELAEKNNSNIAVVTHADPIKLVVCHVIEIPLANAFRFKVDNGSVTYIRIKERPIVKFLNMIPLHT